MKKFSGFICCVLMFVGGAVESEEKKSASWQDCSQGYEYKSEGFSCKINKSGAISKLTAGGWQVTDVVQIYTRLKTRESEKQARVFQDKKKALSIKIRKDGKRLALKASGLLKIDGGKDVARFKEDISFSPNKIDFSYEVKTIVETDMSRWMPFCAYLANKKNPFIGYIFEALDEKGETGVYEIPKEYSKEKESWSKKLKKVKFVEGKEFSISIPENEKTSISVSDGRAWKTNSIDILIRPAVTNTKNKDGFYPAGSVFKWSFSFSFSKE
jgi:hypothetical protein